MNKDIAKRLFISLTMLLVFVIFTICTKTVDVQAIGPERTEVGFATLNGTFHEALGYQEIFYTLSKILGILAILVMLGFVIIGATQLIKRRSLKKVDAGIYALAVFYVLVGGAYIFFEQFIINYRPIDLGEGLEASYPSSHTMLGVCVFCTAAYQAGHLMKDERLKRILVTALNLMAGLMVATRLISGVHWLTDIVGGTLLSGFLIGLYYIFDELFRTLLGQNRLK